MLVKTSDLIGPALDWAVAEAIEWKEPIFCVGRISYIKEDQYLMMEKPDPDELDEVTDPYYFNHFEQWSPSRIWSQGGPLIREHIGSLVNQGGRWAVYTRKPVFAGNGETPLIAACRAIVAAKLGDQVDVPDELMQS